MASKASKATDKKAVTPINATANCPRDFIDSFYANVHPADLTDFSVQDRNLIAASTWKLMQGRKTGELRLRLYNPGPETDGWKVDHTVLETVNDDMPFLVDSLTGALQRRGLAIHLVIHPVFLVERDKTGKLLRYVSNQNQSAQKLANAQLSPESLIHIQFDHCLNTALLREIEAEVREVLADVRAAVEDWGKMKDRLKDAIEHSTASPLHKTISDNAEETKAFLNWLNDNNFTFLGYRDIDLTQKDGRLTAVKVRPGGLGVLRNPEVRLFGGMRDLSAQQSNNLQKYVRQHSLLVITKANTISRVHRTVPLDAIFVRRFDERGQVVGERLFVGLFTSQSYTFSPKQIPFLRSKIDHVITRAGLLPTSHDGKALAHILNHYPHDELFQIGEDELYENSLGILKLQERARVALFVRRDPFERFVTCLVYVPRDRYDSNLRKKIREYLESAFAGQSQDWVVRIDDSHLARVFLTIHINALSPKPDNAAMETHLRELCRSWSDRLRDSLTMAHGEGAALSLLQMYGEAFSPSYQENVSPATAVGDIACLEKCAGLTSAELIVDLSRDEADGTLHLKLFKNAKPIVLSDILPMIENMGLKIEYMTGPYEAQKKGSDTVTFIHEFVGQAAHKPIVSFDTLKPAFESTFNAVWSGNLDNDGFNALSLHAGMGWRNILILRIFAKYLKQLRIPYGQEIIIATLAKHPKVAVEICNLFITRHNPAIKSNREKDCKGIEERLHGMLTSIEALEEDRIIRRYLNLVQSSLRTNFFQKTGAGEAKPYTSIKFDSRAIEFMPLPKPLYEIFVYSSRVEAVHLRGGKVARGGIRWSDRRDDFRNEILGLMKAQMVKNTVIVPVGSKGGFIVKRPPAEADKYQAEGIECYRIMMRGLLDITDNRAGSKIVPPQDVVRHDGDDPYLVVAADKGTAKFSDIANAISQDYGFWLDDAFASGGSAGYDHKHMGITARGAWEAIKRHFREMGKDIQTTDFTCVGVGDMSGDVFGNGMLLSEHTRLLAAFDHRHIFCDPLADAATGFHERKRLFSLPRSSWDDYDRNAISKGGGVFLRTAKSIKISPEMRKTFGIAAESLSPTELVQALLKAEVELIYFGGIGTYVKSSTETHEDVGDRTNDALRIDGCDIRAKVVGEGANLGVTQRGRIEYALKGGRINTDAIDNSAGVDTSDHEVNIKILMRKIMGNGKLTLDERNKILRSMTADVAELVLRDNYQQTQAISVVEAQAAERLSMHSRCMHLLEKAGLLNRKVEFLPDADDIADRQRIGKGLARPEIAVLLAYAKLWLYDQVLASDLPDEQSLQDDLVHYFPQALQKKFFDDIAGHQLRREIIATVITNEVVNRAGSAFALILPEQTRHDVQSVVRAFILARGTLELDKLWNEIEALDNRVPASVQAQMMLVIKKSLTSASQRFLNQKHPTSKIASTIQTYNKGINQIRGWLTKSAKQPRKLETNLVMAGVPAQLAAKVAALPVLVSGLDIIQLANNTGRDLILLTELSFEIGRRFGFDWLQEQARNIQSLTPWQRDAIVDGVHAISALQLRMVAAAVGKTKGDVQTTTLLSNWIKNNAAVIDRYEAMLNDWRASGTVDIAMLNLAAKHLGALG